MAGVALLLSAAGVALLPRRSATASSSHIFRYLPPNFAAAWQADLESLRNAPLVQQLAQRMARWGPPELDYDYAEFVRQTGFNYQRDLDFVGAVVSGLPKARDLNLVAEGHFDRTRMVSYMESRSSGRLSYRGRPIYMFQGRSGPYRLAFLDSDRLAISTAPEESVLHGIIDRVEEGGDSAEQRLRDLGAEQRIPAESQVWMVADTTGLGLPEGTGIKAGSYTVDLLRGSRLLFLSARAGAQEWELQLENECESEADAQSLATALRGFAGLLKALATAPKAGPSPSGESKTLSPAGPGQVAAMPGQVTLDAANPALVQFLESLMISVEGNRFLLKGKVDAATLIRLFLEPPRAPDRPASKAPTR